jgi:hypothetical protein
MQSVELLVNEMQLGNQLSTAVKHNRSSDFSLLLAMMSQNVLDNAEFCLPAESPLAEEVDEAMLRHQFELGEKPVYAATDDSVMQSLLLGVDLHTEGLSEVKLNSYLRAEPLSRFDDTMHIDPQVLTNCEPTVQERHERQQLRLTHRLDQNPAGIYEVLQDLQAA